MPILVKQDILVDSKTESWRFKIADNKLKIINFKQFVLDLVKYSTVYTIVCAGVTEASDNKSVESEIFKELRYLEDVCNNKLAEILSELEKENYAIELQNRKELSFMSLYNFLQNELAILRRYLDNALVKN